MPGALCDSRRVSIESACDGLASSRRLQQTSEISGPGGSLACIRGGIFFLGVLWEVVAKLVAQKLECDMQRLFCFGKTNHTIPIILLRAMLHLFFSSGKLPMYIPISLLSKNTTNQSNLLFETLRH